MVMTQNAIRKTLAVNPVYCNNSAESQVPKPGFLEDLEEKEYFLSGLLSSGYFHHGNKNGLRKLGQ